MRAYAGIGSRDTPADVLDLMESLAFKLGEGWNLRSGAAPGADSAFERGATCGGGGHATELYLPWPGFEGRREVWNGLHRPERDAYDVASQFHPAWDRLSRGAQALHARNAHQILGPDVKQPVLSRFVVCWTKDAAGGGGTGQALRIARHYGVPIFDLAEPRTRRRIEVYAIE